MNKESRHKLNVTIGEAKNIESYFNGNIIGSALLELNGILDYSLVNDVDVAIEESIFWNVNKYLKDKGFKETKTSYKQNGYADFIGSLIYEKDNHLPIHLLFKDKNFTIKSIPEIVKEKFERYSTSDRNQLLYILKNKTSNELWKQTN